MTTFPYGYAGGRRTLEQLLTITVIRRLDAEFRRRLFAMMQAAADQNVSLGIGGGWRSSATQERLFRSRYEVDPKGTVVWNGQRWRHVRGAAAAAPGLSYHESTTGEGAALAVDMVGDLKWMAAHCAAYGLLEFTDLGEPWHVQPVEISRSRRGYSIERDDPLPVWKLPTPDPTPTHPDPPPLRILRRGMEGRDVAGLQDALRTAGYSPGNSDGKFGPRTEGQVKAFQLDHGLAADGVVNAAVWSALTSD